MGEVAQMKRGEMIASRVIACAAMAVLVVFEWGAIGKLAWLLVILFFLIGAIVGQTREHVAAEIAKEGNDG